MRLVAEWRGQLVGSGRLVRWRGGGEIADLVVAPGCRRRGIGRRLVQALVAQARARGLAQVEVGVEADNRPALALYEQLGFVPGRTVHLSLGGRRLALVYLARRL